MQSHADNIRHHVRIKHSNYFRPGYVEWHFCLDIKPMCFHSIITNACSGTVRSWQANSSTYLPEQIIQSSSHPINDYYISLSLSSRKSLKISWKIMSPIFSSFPTVLQFYFQENQQFFTILAELQRQRGSLCYIPATKYDFCLSLGARLRLWNDSITHWS